MGSGGRARNRSERDRRKRNTLLVPESIKQRQGLLTELSGLLVVTLLSRQDAQPYRNSAGASYGVCGSNR